MEVSSGSTRASARDPLTLRFLDRDLERGFQAEMAAANEATWSRLGTVADAIGAESRGPIELKGRGTVAAYLARRHGNVTVHA